MEVVGPFGDAGPDDPGVVGIGKGAQRADVHVKMREAGRGAGHGLFNIIDDLGLDITEEFQGEVDVGRLRPADVRFRCLEAVLDAGEGAFDAFVELNGNESTDRGAHDRSRKVVPALL